jgi:hypothetical protein
MSLYHVDLDPHQLAEVSRVADQAKLDKDSTEQKPGSPDLRGHSKALR